MPASTSATRSIRARTCSTARPSRCSSTRSSGHKRCNINYDPSHFVLQQLDYLDFIDIYHERIKAFHVKDAEFNPTGRQGVYSGYQGWVEPRRPLPLARRRAGRFRRHLLQARAYDYDSWAVLEWECCLKHPEDGAAEGAPFIQHHIIRVTEKAFDDFAGGRTDKKQLSAMLGIWLRRCRQGGGRAWRSRARSEKCATGPHPLGMVGGGQGAFIGAVHRIAARMDGQYELVAGALSSDPERAKASGAELGLDPDAQLRLASRRWRRPRPSGRTASRRSRSSRRTTCTSRRRRRSSKPASMSSATSR